MLAILPLKHLWHLLNEHHSHPADSGLQVKQHTFALVQVTTEVLFSPRADDTEERYIRIFKASGPTGCPAALEGPDCSGGAKE